MNYTYKQYDYLVSLELINKYSFKNIHEIPSIEKISVGFTTKKFLGLDRVYIGSDIQFILLFYSIFSLLSFVSLKKKKPSFQKDSAKVDLNFFFKIVFSNKKDFYDLLINILHPNVMSVIRMQMKKKYLLKSNIYYKFYDVPLKYFGDFTKLLSQINLDLNIDQLSLNLGFVIKNRKNEQSLNRLHFFKMCSFCG
jgi:hypothetical protein